MDLYILRHGIAEEMSQTGLDRDRVLTEEGVEKTRESAKGLRKLDVQFDAIFSSPYARARQTAEIVADQMEVPDLLQLMEELGAESSAALVVSALQKVLRRHSSVLLVGHEPILSEMISLLLSASTGLSVAMKKGGLCKLNCVRPEPGAARLEWLMTSKHLSRIGR